MQGTYNFIKLERIILRNFSMYKKKGVIHEVNEKITDGVYCLAGANGLGKTTFLNAINYGLTGIVLEPNREPYSPKEIVEENKVYTTKYFKGRLSPKVEGKAEIEIILKANDKHFRITRGFFEREELRLLEIYQLVDGKEQFIFKKKEESPKDLNLYYQKQIAAEIGFINFDYFMFYQLYILTFDENRRMIFWDERASSNALSVAFNSDPRDAEKISDIIRLMETHESNGRNARWQATQANNKVKELKGKTKGKRNTSSVKLEIEFNKLHKVVEKFETQFRNVAIEYDTLLKKQSHLNSEIMQQKIEHAKLFSKYSKPRSKLVENTNIQLSLRKQECWVCGSQGSYIVEHIERNIHKDKCPLCDTVIKESNSDEQNRLLKLIQKNDVKISKSNEQLENIIFDVESKNDELEKAEIELTRAKERLEEFVDDYPDVSFKGTGDKNVDSLIEQYQKQFALADEKAKSEYKKRDKLKPEYERLLKRVEAAYKEAQTVFVPIFKKLAMSFIGLDLNIQPKRSDRSIKLVLELQDTARTESFQLSESQRFFLDIALRMSLAIFLSNKNSPATLIVDTPEGSLDIAYESRVGNMFAEFVTIYNQNLFMTANINASQLLISLAEKCGKRKMTFKRMLDWTDLSEIQKEGEALFKKVYLNIEISLNKRR
jgi:energy-coupling factor transporter ATP-binding protein EcfA2